MPVFSVDVVKVELTVSELVVIELPDSREKVAIPVFSVDVVRVELTISELVVIELPDSTE